jgi:tetratricopeptide (TPR) repeat protein
LFCALESGGVNQDSGHGVVIMANNWSFNSQCVMRYLINNIAQEYRWSYRYTPYSPWPYADTVLLATAKLRGAQAAITRYYELKKLWAAQKKGSPGAVVWPSNPPDYPPNEWDLLGLAYTLADPSHLKDAIEIMKVEVAEYPQWWNAYDSLAELYARAGEKQLAIQNYQKSIELNPNNRAGIEALKKLKAQD